MQTAIAFILIFGMLVFFHELGHFLFAKRAGILVREFAIGMGPKIYGKRMAKQCILFDYYQSGIRTYGRRGYGWH